MEVFLQSHHNRIPRGEMWLYDALFRETGKEDSIGERLRICQELGMDIIFLPVTIPEVQTHLFNYRYFHPDDLKDLAANNRSLLIGAIVNGPFQQLWESMGLTALLRRWTAESEDMLKSGAELTGRLISITLGSRPHLLVIADDIAYQRSTLVNPAGLSSLFNTYREWIELAHERGVSVFFHSDGNLAPVLAEVFRCGFDGLAGCQMEFLTGSLKAVSSPHPWLMAGIPNELLEAEDLDESHKKPFGELLAELTDVGQLLLCSSGGLSSAKHLTNLRTLYRWADEVCKR
jgi:uroporphyrinogen decarboxylase